MPQHDYDIANGSGAAFRADLNAVLAAIASTNKGPAAPTAAQAGMLWVEDDNPSATQWTVRMFDGADWIAIGVLDAATNTFAPANALLTTGGTLTGALAVPAGSASAPFIAPTGDANTGIFAPDADMVAVSTGGVERLRIGNSGQIGIAGANYGTSGHVLTSNGASAAPSWQAVAAADGSITPAKLSTGGPSWNSGGNLSFNSGYGSVATAFGCRAWVNFNGTGTVAIRASGNVSSIGDLGVGQYQVNFTTAMPDANYSAQYTASDASNAAVVGAQQSNTASSAQVATVSRTDTQGFIDVAFVQVAIFR